MTMKVNKIIASLACSIIFSSVSAYASESEFSIGMGQSSYNFNNTSVDGNGDNFTINLQLHHYPYEFSLDNSEISLGLTTGLIYVDSYKSKIVDNNDNLQDFVVPGSGINLFVSSKYQYQNIFGRLGIGATIGLMI